MFHDPASGLPNTINVCVCIIKRVFIWQHNKTRVKWTVDYADDLHRSGQHVEPCFRLFAILTLNVHQPVNVHHVPCERTPHTLWTYTTYPVNVHQPLNVHHVPCERTPTLHDTWHVSDINQNRDHPFIIVTQCHNLYWYSQYCQYFVHDYQDITYFFWKIGALASLSPFVWATGPSPYPWLRILTREISQAEFVGWFSFGNKSCQYIYWVLLASM